MDILLTNALESTPSLSEHLDEDTTEYILSILHDDPRDEDAREAVTGFILGHDIEAEVCEQFFTTLDNALSKGCYGVENLTIGTNDQHNDQIPRKLDNAVTLKEHDIETFASGLVADKGTGDLDTTSDIQAFYANMIDVSNNPAAKSERARRKARQKELREKMEAEERERALADAMKIMEEEENMRNNEKEDMGELTTAADNASDVQLINFSLPNRKGGGPDLLSDSNLTLASKRRYGLMGRNGCGKTTLLTALAARQLNGDGGGVPKSMAMLLVRQEIMGNELSAVETVLKSDVKREGVKRWIEYIEQELTKLDNPQAESEVVEEAVEQKASKGKQKLKDRKKNKAAAAAAKKATVSKKKTAQTPEEDADEKRKRLNTKLAAAYERLARIEEEEGTNPESKARKVLHGLGFTTPEMQDKPTKELSGKSDVCIVLYYEFMCSI